MIFKPKIKAWVRREKWNSWCRGIVHGKALRRNLGASKKLKKDE